jgi:hypothetical protein
VCPALKNQYRTPKIRYVSYSLGHLGATTQRWTSGEAPRRLGS